MKKLLFITVLAILSQFVQAQTSDYVVGIAVGNNRSLYVGVKNEVTIVVSELSTNDYTVSSSSNITILNLGQGKFEITPTSPGVITIDVKNKNNNTKIGSYEFYCINLPKPVLLVAFRNGGVIEKNMLTTQPRLRVEYPNIAVKADFLIYSFVVEVEYNSLKKEQLSFGGIISDAQRKLIQDATSGNKVTFKDVKVRNKKGEELILDPITFTIN